MSIFKPMRSCHPDPKFPLQPPYLVSRKYDGIRLVRHEDKLITKSGKQLPNKHIRNWCLANVPPGFDFEVISGPPNLETTYNTTYRAAMTIEGEPDFHLYMFDLCDRDNMYAIDRYKRLQCFPANQRIVVVEKYLCTDMVQVQAYYDQFLSEGYEGAILQTPDSFYKSGKCTPKENIQLKLKPEDDFDATIIDVYEAERNDNEAFLNELGETKRSTHAENKVGKGIAGGFLARDHLTGETIRIGCGKMKHAERAEVWQDKTNYIGRGFVYRSMTYGVKDAPRQGRWYRWRDTVDMEPAGA
jgi:DNA ligase-1